MMQTGGWYGKSAKMSTLVARFSGPPADRQTGRPSRMAKAKARTQAAATPALSIDDKDEILDHAVYTGVISAGLRDHFSALWEADPEGTRRYLHNLGLQKMGLNPDQPGIGETSQGPGAPEGANIPDLAMTSSDYPGLSVGERRQIEAAKQLRTAPAGSSDYNDSHLTVAERKRIAAAREGKRPRVVLGGL